MSGGTASYGSVYMPAPLMPSEAPIDTRNTSPQQYGSSSVQLPPTPSSVVTNMGPNSGNSNSNEGINKEMIEIDNRSPSLNESMPNQHSFHNFTSWSDSSAGLRHYTPLSPPDSSLNTSPLAQIPNCYNLPTDGTLLQHQPLTNLNHSSAKQYGLTQSYYPTWA